MDAKHFRQLLTARRPFASVYFEDSPDTEDASAQLDLKLRDMRHQLVQQGADDPVITDIERAVVGQQPPIGHSGLAVIADTDGVILNEHLLHPTPTVVRVSQLPYIVPVIERGFEYPNHVLVAVDRTGADITVRVNGRLYSQTVGSAGHPVHNASGAETAQPHAQEAVHRNVRAIADRVAEVASYAGADAVFVAGETRARSDLLAALPKRVTERVVVLQLGARRSGHDYSEVRQAIEAECLKRRLTELDDATRRFAAETGRRSGLATDGLAAVCSALSQGAVDTLIVGEMGDATVVADGDLAVTAPNPDLLSEYGAAAHVTLRADEALPIGAISIGAGVVHADERINPADGIAAVLRYPVQPFVEP